MIEDALQAVQIIYQVGKAIYAQVELVKANKSQCRRLNERVQIVLQAIHQLDVAHNPSQYLKGLNAMKERLDGCLNFVKKFTASGRWYRYVLATQHYQQVFAELHQSLLEACHLLNLGLNAQQIINHDQDQEDAKKDMADIQGMLGTVIELNEHALQELQLVKADLRQRDELIFRQLASLREQWQPKAAPTGLALTSHERIGLQELTFMKILRQHAEFILYQGFWLDQAVTIKQYAGKTTERERELLLREVALLRKLRHPLIVQCYGATLEADHAGLVTEAIEGPSLYERLAQNRQPLALSEQKHLGLALARALEYLHQQGVLHHDLSSHHLYGDSQRPVKLSDVGLATVTTGSIVTLAERDQPVKWQAPECFARRSDYTVASDVFSFGTILWEMATGFAPYETYQDTDYIQAITQGERASIPTQVHPILTQLIQDCWQQAPEQRPTVSTLINTLNGLSITPLGESDYQEGLKAEVQKDLPRARIHYQAAQSQGFFKASTNLGTFYLYGLGGLPKDKSKAYAAFLDGAQGGHPRAMYNLATMLEHGDGVPQDTRAAIDWYQKAVQGGDTKAPAKLQRLQQSLQQQSQDYEGNLATNTTFR